MRYLGLPDTFAHWVDENQFMALREQLDQDGYAVIENVLDKEQINTIKGALSPYLNQNIRGRNEFEGRDSNRVYAMLAKSPVFAELVTHPLAMAFVEADLGTDCLLSACLAINLHPGETAQPWHFDDAHCTIPRPRQSLGVSSFWAITDTTEDNGATEIIPGSHLWGDEPVNGALEDTDFDKTGRREGDPGAREDAKKVIMPAGSLMIAKGTLWHRGGANNSDAPRLLITPQYCAGYMRQLENMLLAVPADIAKTLPKRAQELLGYSICSPFMGYVDGRHPARLLS
ncbi:phytanoyl-CoA dioxygenase family protein [Hyphococcus sp. DH-69]|uniref:phytanoyl-CoA dioxygenase family protein n=1 Tax=Hyphococcus formosus TaxID=3143534 RepID=UPI00398A9391